MYINRPFRIASEVGEKKVLDLVSNRGVIKTQTDRKTQVFKFDWKTRTIKSQGYSTEWSHSLDMRNQWMYVYGTGSQWHQLFRYNKNTKQFYNQRGKIMDLKSGKDQEGEYVGTDDAKKGRTEQRWTIKYLDQTTGPATKGKGSMGLDIGRPFYI
jgi:hypothetical protein